MPKGTADFVPFDTQQRNTNTNLKKVNTAASVAAFGATLAVSTFGVVDVAGTVSLVAKKAGGAVVSVALA